MKNSFKLSTFLKKKLVTAPIIVVPNWGQEFKLMCDICDYSVGAILGQKEEWKISCYLLCQQGAKWSPNQLCNNGKGDT